MEITPNLKFQTGQWVAAEFPGGARPGKVVAADRDLVVVEYRSDAGPMKIRYEEHNIHRISHIRWIRNGGRRTWRYAR